MEGPRPTVDRFDEFAAHEKRNLRTIAKLEHFEFRDVTCQFLRVSHTKETADEYAEELRNFIAQAEILITELVVLDDSEYAGEMECFYRKITELAAQEKKLMVIPDPEKNIAQVLVNRSLDLAPLATTALSVPYVAYKLKQILDAQSDRAVINGENSEEDERVKIEAKMLTRRNFLKFTGAATIAAVASTSSAASLLLELKVDIEPDGVLEHMLVHSLNYRDACIAKEILERSMEYKNISVIYGADHYKGVKKFLQDPEQLAEKLKLYEMTYGIVVPPHTEAYDFREPPVS